MLYTLELQVDFEAPDDQTAVNRSYELAANVAGQSADPLTLWRSEDLVNNDDARPVKDW